MNVSIPTSMHFLWQGTEAHFLEIFCDLLLAGSYYSSDEYDNLCLIAITIRPYLASDIKAVTALISELQDHIAMLDIHKRNRPAKEFDAKKYIDLLLEKISTQNGIILIAEEVEKIVGCIVGMIPATSEEDLLEEYPSREGRILELIVQENQRGKKIGAALLEAMEGFFRKEKCDFVRTGVFAPNVRAHEFYKKYGYEDRYLDVLKKI